MDIIFILWIVKHPHGTDLDCFVACREGVVANIRIVKQCFKILSLKILEYEVDNIRGKALELHGCCGSDSF